MKVEHIIWDWNGTLLDDAPACVETLNVILAKRNLPQVDLDGYREVFGFPVQDYYIKLGIDFEQEDWNSMAKEFHDIYWKVSRERPLRPGIVEILDSLSASPVSMTVLSASEISFLENELINRKIRQYFDGIYGLDDIYAHSKLEAGKKLMGEIAHQAAHVLLVGDTVHDYEVASALNCQCLLMPGGHQSEQRLRQCDCSVLSDLDTFLDTLLQYESG